MMPPGKIQVPGFCSNDSYSDVVEKGAKGLNITHPPDKLQFLVSNGLVTNGSLHDGKSWTLGSFSGGSRISERRFPLVVDHRRRGLGAQPPAAVEVLIFKSILTIESYSILYLRPSSIMS